MNHFTLDDNDVQVSGRKGKTCSMTGCNNTHQRFPNMSFFRFPKELSRFVFLNRRQKKFHLQQQQIIFLPIEQRNGLLFASDRI